MTPDFTRLEEKQLESFILKYFYKCIRTPASIRTASRRSSTILSEQRIKTAEQIT